MAAVNGFGRRRGLSLWWQTFQPCHLISLIARLGLRRSLAWLLRLLLGRRRSLCLGGLLRLSLRSRRTRAARVQNLLQLLAVQRRIPRGGDTVLVGESIGLWALRQLLLVRRQRKKGSVFLAHQVLGGQNRDRPDPENPIAIYQEKNDRQVDNHGNPKRLAHSRASQIVLHLQQYRWRIQIDVSL